MYLDARAEQRNNDQTYRSAHAQERGNRAKLAKSKDKQLVLAAPSLLHEISNSKNRTNSKNNTQHSATSARPPHNSVVAAPSHPRLSQRAPALAAILFLQPVGRRRPFSTNFLKLETLVEALMLRNGQLNESRGTI